MKDSIGARWQRVPAWLGTAPGLAVATAVFAGAATFAVLPSEPAAFAQTHSAVINTGNGYVPPGYPTTPPPTTAPPTTAPPTTAPPTTAPPTTAPPTTAPPTTAPPTTAPPTTAPPTTAPPTTAPPTTAPPETMPPTTAPPMTTPPRTSPPTLPVTGPSTATGALIAGLLMLLAGVGIVLGLRRRRSNKIA